MTANASLAALYRPQTFAEVVGQDMVKSILSRASREDRVAPAYLLSGTRGVGKTTIARIFAKALNCEKAPTGEPCNQCDACRRITQGSFVDVVEIDGASNRGIDDIRRLRDAVGYAPLEGRYKVFIIDEAHMLTKEAFNALLKTLEEPPAHVTFILATTEQHKFPVTILSRCQHFVFRQIPEDTLEAHVCRVLECEGRAYEKEAARLIARRAAGSVRDSMSLLGQVLALGGAPGEPLAAGQVREVLGLAGREVMDRLLDGIAAHDSASIIALVGELLSQGIDMGFFLRELTGLWRDLFLACQPGKSLWDGQEKKAMAASAARFSPSFIHAAWQMTLDSQRRILTSLEPSIGLELLLLNLAMLPRLLPLRELSTVPAPENMAGLVSSRKIPAEEKDLSASVFELVPANAKSGDEAFMVKKKSGDMSESEAALEVKKPLARPFAREVPREHAENDRACVYAGSGVVSQGWKHADIDQELRWENFLLTMGDDKDLPMPLLRQITGEIRGDWLVLQPFSQVVAQKMQIVERRGTLEKRVETWAGRHLEVVFRSPQKIVRTEAEIKEEINRHALVKKFQDSFDAVLVHVKS